MQHDIAIIRELAKQAAEIAALPRQEETRRLWRGLNGLRPERPMVMIDQVCWHEMNVNDELTLRCHDKELREHELALRKILYQWKHFPVDFVLEDFINVPKAIGGTRFSIITDDTRLATDTANDVVSHSYANQFLSVDDLHKIETPAVTHDSAETARRAALAHELYGGILAVRPIGAYPYISIWDPISWWMGVENALYAIMDNESLIRGMIGRIVAGWTSVIDQLEAQGLVAPPQSVVHCTGAWTDELPKPGYDPARPRAQDIWCWGLAQMFSTVSPAMHAEFEIEPSLPLFERFGLTYYGCCEPLDQKMDCIKRIPNVRKVSMSPWARVERGAQAIGKDYVYSCKPNPAFLAHFDEDAIRRELTGVVAACKRYGCPVELILKDISTVGYKPQNLWRWAEIAMEVVQS
jgi:hypothetical protein